MLRCVAEPTEAPSPSRRPPPRALTTEGTNVPKTHEEQERRARELAHLEGDLLEHAAM